MVIVACHRWYIKLRNIRDMAETSLVVRDGNGNCNSSPTFLFSIWGHPKIPCVSKNIVGEKTTTIRDSGNTRPIRSSSTQGWNTVHSWTLAMENIVGGSVLGFHDIRRGESIRSLLKYFAILIFACLRYLYNTLPCYRYAFLIMHHISNVAS